MVSRLEGNLTYAPRQTLKDTNALSLEPHRIPAATSIEETSVKLVEVKVRIARARDILGAECKVQYMQNITALFQVTDPITKQISGSIDPQTGTAGASYCPAGCSSRALCCLCVTQAASAKLRAR